MAVRYQAETVFVAAEKAPDIEEVHARRRAATVNSSKSKVYERQHQV